MPASLTWLATIVVLVFFLLIGAVVLGIFLVIGIVTRITGFLLTAVFLAAFLFMFDLLNTQRVASSVVAHITTVTDVNIYTDLNIKILFYISILIQSFTVISEVRKSKEESQQVQNY